MARGHQVDVVTLADEPEAARAQDWPFPVHRVKRRQFMPWRIVRTIALVVRRAFSADIVLANTLGVEATLGARLAGRPVVHKVVGDYAWERARNRGWFPGTMDEYQDARLGWRLRLLNLWRSMPLRVATHVFVPSRYLAKIVCGWRVPADRVSVIYNSYIRPSGARIQPPLGGARVIVLTACRLVPWKHVDGVIAAVAPLENVELWIAGDGPLRRELEQQRAKTAGGEKVRFLGQLEAGQVMECMQRADVFVLNSSYEGLPHVVIEAMGAGMTVVATLAGGTPELVRPGFTGVLVPVGEAAQLQVALERAIQSPAEAQRLAENGRRFVEEQFSMERMLVDTEALLTKHARRP
jgi:glycosyltransferase involved in cell wall biosynthesis